MSYIVSVITNVPDSMYMETSANVMLAICGHVINHSLAKGLARCNHPFMSELYLAS